jgi:hypothetical protein
MSITLTDDEVVTLSGHISELVEHFVDHTFSWSNPLGLVFDPFLGYGTTGKKGHFSHYPVTVFNGQFAYGGKHCNGGAR